MSLVVKFTADTAQFEKGIKNAQGVMENGKATAEKLDATLGKLKTAFAGVVTVAGIAKITSAVKGLADSTATAADRIDKQSQALGMSRKAYQQWDYILGQSGASIDSLGVSMKTLNNSLLNPSDGTITALNTLGVNLEQIQGLSQEDAFEMMVRQFQKMPEGATKSALAMQMFGKQGQALMPLLNSTSDTIDNLRKDMERMGFEMSDSMVDAGVKYGDTMDNLKRTLEGVKNILGYGLMESLTGIAEEMTKFFSNQDVQDAIKRLAVNIHDMGAVVLSHVQGFFAFLTEHSGDIEQVVSNVAQFVSDISAIIVPALAAYAAFKLITNPIALISAGVAAIAVNWPTIKEFFTSKVPEWVNQTFGIDISEFKLPDPLEAVNKIKAWWNGGEDGGGVKNLVAKFLDWYLQAPGEPQGDPIAVIKAWWEEKKQQAQDAIKWALSLPSAPHEGGEKLRKTILEWWNKHKTRAEEAIKWVLSLPTMPEVTGENGVVEKVKKWWTDSVAPSLNGILSFVLGVAGMPDADVTVSSITQWWDGVVSSTSDLLNLLFGVDNPDPNEVVAAISAWWDGVIKSLGELFNVLFGVDTPDFEVVVGGIKAWWDNALKSLGNYIQATFGVDLPDASQIVKNIQEWWNGIVSSLTLWLPTWMGGSGGSSSGLGRQGGAGGSATGAQSNSGGHFASGLDYVRNNNQLAFLHEGEAVLNKRDAEEWRRGGNKGATAEEIAQAVSASLDGMSVMMGKDIVGKLVAQVVGRELEREARAGRFATA